MENDQTVMMFDASLQREAPHTIDIDGNGEIVLTSAETGRFVKLPATTTPDELKAYIAEHKAANEGQITVASIEEKKAELVAALTEEAPASQ
jgi:hypothetical protein